MYGSKTGALDKAEAAANSVDAAAVQAWFDVRGFDFAEDIFATYLGNNGPDFVYEISEDDVERVIATTGARQKVAECLDAIRNQARLDPRVGTTREITSEWLGAAPAEDDLFYALGHYDIAVGSDTTVYEESGVLHADIVYRIYVYEFYNFDQEKRKTFSLNIGVDINNEMRQLEEAGWARSFRVHGAAPRLERWTGAL